MLAFHPHDTAPAAVESGSAPGAGRGEAEVDSARLLRGRRELLIRHGDECYRLRHTRNDKLILTK
ncbi:hemin uptake protein HemP [Luteimonas sp. SJ-92]|uniref:Hemin uptake protein HemP n=1 Tax=Luteimonas salinisoli TaxID=2752307 RepID=A0A853JFN6_9GAMM|nr:hemin uptake protein HemP [Luteimonas salinisoli]NZA28146.1 hemin uptake protein HemP [Luteimonas salinisoli]